MNKIEIIFWFLILLFCILYIITYLVMLSNFIQAERFEKKIRKWRNRK